MEGIFLGTSLLAAFVAGAVALFAPCCITVVFPSYLAAAVRNHRWRLVPLTLVFGAGVAVVLVPITLGLSLLTETLLQYNLWVYGAGAILMLALAWAAASGATWSLPFMRGAPDIARTDSGGVFALGVFSGAASACCAPVLVGVLTLAAVAPGPLAATGVGLAYVLEMVFPMLLATLWWGAVGRLRRASSFSPFLWRITLRPSRDARQPPRDGSVGDEQPARVDRSLPSPDLSARHLTATDQGLLPGSPATTRTGLPPAWLVQFPGATRSHDTGRATPTGLPRSLEHGVRRQ